MRLLIALGSFAAVTALGSFSPGQLKVTSPSFHENGNIPSTFTCEGRNVSPALHIAEIPKNTKTLAIICHDPDAPMSGGFTHWVLWNIDPRAEIPEGFGGGDKGVNGMKKPGYTGMCPPTGTHHYHFMVYALDTRLDLRGNADKDELMKKMEGHVLAKDDLVGLYKKMK